MKLNNRNVVDVEIENVDPRDYPDFCDAYFCYAIWEDTKEELTDEELMQLTKECGDELNEMAHDYYR
jgi:hypothetical protein